MKKLMMCLLTIIASLMVMPVHAGVQDFYFSDFTADYYLSKDDAGVSHLKVVESMTAEFPEYRQNKGICRQIPFTNQNGANLTLPSLTEADITVTRNGIPEPIYSIDREEGKGGNYYYDVCTGTEDYVLGTQVYTMEYEFTNVVTEFTEDGRVFQELYWDTNGNGWRQRFDQLTARIHFAEPEVWSGESWCYVDKYGTSGQERCKAERIADGVEFKTSSLAVGENLTFDVELKAGSYVVPEPKENYIYVWVVVVLGVVCMVVLGIMYKGFLESREKARYYKGLFVKPEYQPNSEYSLPEMAAVYIGKRKDSKVAMLLELVVGKKIEFVKGEKKRQWKLNVKNLDNVSSEYIDLLSILNNATKPNVGDVIELKSRTATSKLIALRKAMENAILANMKRNGLVEKDFKWEEKRDADVTSVLTKVIYLSIFIIPFASMILTAFVSGPSYAGKMVFKEYYLITVVIILMTTIVICAILSVERHKYIHHTMEGLKMARYMDGLKLYIGMAEAERMKMLQSVEGADTSAEGIVRLYEKLLPYAAIFGLEESWMNEMKKYCKVEEIEQPDYLTTGLAISDLTRGMRMASDVANTSTVMSSSGGSMSSGFSGGGGGGFSGGGGGGGGGGGR